MNAIVSIFLGVVVLMGIVTAISYHFMQKYFLVPSLIVVLIGVGVSINGYIGSEGWDSLNYLFVFISILLGVTIGALSPILFKKYDG
ncbi:MAG: hypothetical protein KBT36_00155 [Kurthia sp.]|nr:hypothetical protein [Candidatus Kurthia equi]